MTHQEHADMDERWWPVRESGVAEQGQVKNNVGLLSEQLHRRLDHGLDPAVLGRNALEAFLNRLAHLEFTGRESPSSATGHTNSRARTVRRVPRSLQKLQRAAPM